MRAHAQLECRRAVLPDAMRLGVPIEQLMPDAIDEDDEETAALKQERKNQHIELMFRLVAAEVQGRNQKP